MEVKSSSNATPNTTHFRFLDLPAEIRNMTYTLALCEDQPILGVLEKQSKSNKLNGYIDVPV